MESPAARVRRILDQLTADPFPLTTHEHVTGDDPADDARRQHPAAQHYTDVLAEQHRDLYPDLDADNYRALYEQRPADNAPGGTTHHG